MPTLKQLKYWESKKGKPTWNKGKKGLQSWSEERRKKAQGRSFFKGKTHSDFSKEKMRIAKLGRKLTPEQKEIAIKNLTYRHPKGQDSCMKGKHHSLETKEKIRIAKSGEKSNLWKGGISKLTPLIRGCFKYRLWRSDVFTRDNYTCQNCGIKSGCGHTVYFEAHHIKSQSKIIEEYQIKTLEDAILCQELWNINNGTTLCRECHKLTDTYAGRNRFKSLSGNS